MNTPLEITGQRQRAQRWLLGLVVLLAAGNGLLALGYYRRLTTPPPIYYVPGATGEGMALPNELPEGAVRDFALHYLVASNNFTPDTLAAVRQATAPMLDPAFVSRSARVFDELERKAVQLALSSQLVLLDGPAAAIVRPVDGDRYEISAHAVYRLFVRSALTQETRYRYHIIVRRASPSVLNPYGLYVQDLRRVLDEPKGDS